MLYPLRPCDHCGKPGTDRHHRDRNPCNNAPENVAVLCESCHILEHGDQMRDVRYNGGVRNGFRNPYKGVCWHRHQKRWVVQFKVDGRNQTIYSSHDPEDAAVVYDAAVIAFRGRGYTNLIPVPD